MHWSCSFSSASLPHDPGPCRLRSRLPVSAMPLQERKHRPRLVLAQQAHEQLADLLLLQQLSMHSGCARGAPCLARQMVQG